MAPAAVVQGSPLGAGEPRHMPASSQVAWRMQLLPGSQGELDRRSSSMHWPVPGSQAAILQAELAAGQAMGSSSQLPKAQTAVTLHSPPAEQAVPLILGAPTQAPVAASQTPTWQAPSRAEQSLGIPEQTPALHTPWLKHPLRPHSPPEVGWYSQSPVSGRHWTVLQSRSMQVTGWGSGTHTPARQMSLGVQRLASASQPVPSGLATDTQPPCPSQALETRQAVTGHS